MLDYTKQIARERDSNIIIIARLGSREYSLPLLRRRVSSVSAYILMGHSFSRDRVVTAQGERIRGLGQVEIYISGREFLILKLRRNRDIFTGCEM
jgi:hypothetical protein